MLLTVKREEEIQEEMINIIGTGQRCGKTVKKNGKTGLLFSHFKFACRSIIFKFGGIIERSIKFSYSAMHYSQSKTVSPAHPIFPDAP